MASLNYFFKVLFLSNYLQLISLLQPIYQHTVFYRISNEFIFIFQVGNRGRDLSIQHLWLNWEINQVFQVAAQCLNYKSSHFFPLLSVGFTIVSN